MFRITSTCIIKRLATEIRSSVSILYHLSFVNCRRADDELRSEVTLLLKGFAGHIFLLLIVLGLRPNHKDLTEWTNSLRVGNSDSGIPAFANGG